jgi:hypothetical protein
MKPENSTNVGGAPGGLGGTTGVDPKSGHRRGPGEERAFEPGPDSTGGQIENTERSGGPGASSPGGDRDSERARETRAFASTEPGHVPAGGEGGGAMSGRGQERGPINDNTGEPSDSDMSATMDGRAGVGGAGEDETSGTGENSVGGTGRAAGGDAHLGKDGEKLGDPMNAKRQATSDENSDMSNGSGAD